MSDTLLRNASEQPVMNALSHRPFIWVAQGWWVEDTFEGVLEAAAEYGWDLDYSMRHTRAGTFPFPPRADGVIVFTGPCLELIPHVRALNVPIVDLEPFEEHYPGSPKVVVSNESAGQHAAFHLAAGDPDRLIFLRPAKDFPANEARLLGFMDAACKVGVPVEVMRIADFDPVLLASRGRIGVFGAVDAVALIALHRCIQAGIDVPGQIAVLGANDDEPCARLVKPLLSSVATARRLQGRIAADMLKRLMDGDMNLPRETAVPVSGVRARGSTITPQTGNPELDRLAAHFRENAHRAETVSVLCEECGIPERTAARLCKKLDVSPRELLSICRLRLAERFAVSGKLTAAAVAAASGFGGAAALARASNAGLSSWEKLVLGK